tara:strand:- start:386 stop:607 length:222 start_codon:yes stop_codon:yes gene_type:complete
VDQIVTFPDSAAALSIRLNDEFHVTKDKMHIHDFHATVLHLMGLDHTQLTYHYSGRDYRLTDVHGNVARDIIA